MRSILALAASALLASGCGQKGPLYLRDSPPPGIKPAKSKPYEPVPYPRELTEEEKK
ncbi:MAG TPA: lipoprotein [Burkholderiales bacterium]|nr:lipoprotein [Burkholderiales bacterium]